MSRSKIHFFPRPREAEPFTRAFGAGIFATRLLRRPGRNPREPREAKPFTRIRVVREQMTPRNPDDRFFAIVIGKK